MSLRLELQRLMLSPWHAFRWSEGAKESGYRREHCTETLWEWSRAKSIRQTSGMSKIPTWRALDDIFGESGCELKGNQNGV